ncbi:MAG: hypothetical protein ACREH6_13715 [Geminicoccaceae bacterium]
MRSKAVDATERDAAEGTAGGMGWHLGAVLILGAGALAGIVLWSRWGFLVALEAVRGFCF